MPLAPKDEFGGSLSPVSAPPPAVPLTPVQVDAQAAQYAYQAAATAAQNAPTPANIAAAKNAFNAQTAANAVPGSSTTPDYAAIAATVPQTITDTQAAVDAANTATATVTGLTTDLATITGTAVAGSTGMALGSERTLSIDTFKNTLALLFGPLEASQPWVNEIFGLVSGFYKSGSSIDEALNLGLYDAKAKGLAPKFTDRFAGVFALQDKLNKGEAVIVPTIADFIKSEADMGAILRDAGLGDLANQKFLGDVIGMGNSVLDVANLISSTFNTIDNAPKALRQTLDTYFPSVDRTSLAKALLTGKEGAAALDKKIKGISVLSAAGTQGINTDLASASDIAAMGIDYNQALTGFGQVKELQRADTLARFGGGTFTQQEAIGLTFAQNEAAKAKVEAEKMKEFGRFGGGAGTAPSALRGRSAKTVI